MQTDRDLSYRLNDLAVYGVLDVTVNRIPVQVRCSDDSFELHLPATYRTLGLLKPFLGLWRSARGLSAAFASHFNLTVWLGSRPIFTFRPATGNRLPKALARAIIQKMQTKLRRKRR